MVQTEMSFDDLVRRVNEADSNGCVDLGRPLAKPGQKSPCDTVFLVSKARIYDRNLLVDNFVRSGVMTEGEADHYLTLQVPWKIRKSIITQRSSIDEAVEPSLTALAKLVRIKPEEALSDFNVVAGYLIPCPALVGIHNQSILYCTVSMSARQKDEELTPRYGFAFRGVRLCTDIPLDASVFGRETSLVCESLLESSAAGIQQDLKGEFRQELLYRQKLLQWLFSYLRDPKLLKMARASGNS